jgi:ribulose-phosphate 3-epimerase
MIDVIAGIYEADELELIEKLKLVTPYLDNIQIDFSDGTYVSKLSITDAALLKKIISIYPKHIFEAHLMVASPAKYIKPFTDAGFKRLIAHVECNDPRIFLDEAEFESVEVGMAIDAATEIEVIEPFLEEIDFVLVMTAEAGASGQSFMPETVEKIRTIRENLPDLPIEVDCGINATTAKIVIDAGATRLAVTSAIFHDPRHIAQTVKELKGE